MIRTFIAIVGLSLAAAELRGAAPAFPWTEQEPSARSSVPSNQSAVPSASEAALKAQTKADSKAKADGMKVIDTHIEVAADPNGSDPFGINLFRGNFSNEPFTGFNPDYQIALGDQISVRLWGAIDYDQVLTVDPQGNVFLPKVGPIRLLNIRNQELNKVLTGQVEKVYLKNVGTYSSLATNQPVKVYVAGFVSSPGLYSGLNTDSIMSFVDKAGGISSTKGSYRDIQVLRGGKVFITADLYSFIMEGRIPPVQFHDGDTVLVNAKGSSVRVKGLVQNHNTFEIDGGTMSLGKLLQWARVTPEASHVRLTHNHGEKQSFEYFPLAAAINQTVTQGDVVEVVADKQLRNIAVRVEGEHNSAYEYILPPGSTLADVLGRIELTKLSDGWHVQLFRKSVKETQKERIQTSLANLEKAVLGASSSSKEEAEIRAREADMLLKLIEKARKVEPKGQVVVAEDTKANEVLLEAGDVVVIPQVTNVVMIHGEVMFPNAIIYQDGLTTAKAIEQAGGYTHRADKSQTIVLHRNGAFETQSNGWFSSNIRLKPGDEIFVLPEVDSKTFQMSKDIVEILYHLAVTTKVVLDI